MLFFLKSLTVESMWY